MNLSNQQLTHVSLIKKMVPLFIMLFVIISITTSCCKEKQKITTITAEDYEKNGHLISLEDAASMHSNYVTKILPSINATQRERLKNSNYEGTQTVWIDMEHIKNYIAFLEEVAKKNPEQPKISGINIYFGNYGIGTNNYSGRGEKYDGRETIFFNPTFKNSKAVHKPFKIMPKNEATDKFIGDYTVFSEIEIHSKSSVNGKKNTGGSISNKANTGNSINILESNGTSLADNSLLCSPPQ